MRPFGALLFLLASGCSSTLTPGGTTPNRYQLFASGFLGCRARDIAVTEFVGDSSGTASWVATCAGRTFVCGGYAAGAAHCTELVP